MTDENASEQQLVEQLRRRVASLDQALRKTDDEVAEQLRDTEHALRILMDASPECVMLLDTHETVIFANATVAKRFDTTVDKIIGRTIFDLFPPDVAASRAERLHEVVSTGQPIRMEDERDGRYCVSTLHPVIAEKGRVAAVFVFCTDRTEQKQAEESLKKARDELEQRVRERTEQLTRANDELQAIYGGMIDGLLVGDLETTRFVRANAAACQMLGYSEEEVLSLTPADIHPPKTAKSVLEKFRTKQEGQKLISENRAVVRKDGTIFFADISNTRITYNGRPCIIGLFRDITDRKLAQEALRQSEEKHRGVLEASPDGIVMTDLNGRVLFASAQTRDLVRIPDYEPLIGQNVFDYVIESDRHRLTENIAKLASSGLRQHTQYTALRRDGTTFPAELSSAINRDADGKPVAAMAIIRDITDRKLAEEKLRKEHRTLRRLLQSSDHERQLIAYEIHDGLAQQLAGAIMQFQSYAHQKDDHPRLAAKAYDAGMTMLRQAHFEARRLIAGVRPPILDESGVVAAVGHLVNEQGRLKKPKIDYRVQVEFDRLTPVIENAIYRIIQEGLTNACLHGNSEKVRVSLVQRDDRIQIIVRDWGVGFDVKSSWQNRFGLEGIRQRARLLGGKCKIRSRIGNGTRIVVELPVVARDA